MIRSFVLLFFASLVFSPQAFAQQICMTTVGSCPIQAGIPGGSCACFSAMGPVPGMVGGGMAYTPQQLPSYCCTPAGKIGPLPNFGIGVGQYCTATLPTGLPVAGQACY